MFRSQLVVLLLVTAPLVGCIHHRADSSGSDSQTRITRYFTDLAQHRSDWSIPDADRMADADIEKMRRLIAKDWRDHQAKLADQQQAMIKQAEETAKQMRAVEQDRGSAPFKLQENDTSVAEKPHPLPFSPRSH